MLFQTCKTFVDEMWEHLNDSIDSYKLLFWCVTLLGEWAFIGVTHIPGFIENVFVLWKFMDSKTWGWVNDVYPVDYPVKMIIAGHRNGCLMRYERNEKQEKETFIILFSLQIQEDIRIKFCSTEEIHEDGCISAGLVCFGSTVHLLIGVTLILNLKLHFLFLPQKIIWKLYLRASVNSN